MKSLIKTLLVLIVLLSSCSENQEYEINGNINEFSEIIEKYNLIPLKVSEFSGNLNELETINSPEQLAQILNTLNVSTELSGYEENFINENNENYHPKRIKTRSESNGNSENVYRIVGSNKDGSATVYVKPAIPSVEGSSYQLGLMDAFVAYQHQGGNASKSYDMVNFTAYGEGVVKLIWNQIELYKFNVTITGYCSSDGSSGKLTSF